MYSYPQYAANATVAMPNPGKLPLNRLNRVKGPEYRHASLFQKISKLIRVSAKADGNSRSHPWVVCSRSSRSGKCLRIEACEVGLGSSPYTVTLGLTTVYTLTHLSIDPTDLVIRILKGVILHEAVSEEKVEVLANQS
jgi:hypothetical protein